MFQLLATTFFSHFLKSGQIADYAVFIYRVLSERRLLQKWMNKCSFEFTRHCSCKPQPALIPDADSTLRKIAQWKHIISTDLSKAFYPIPQSHTSTKYCGVVTPFRGVRVYIRCSMGMPGSETALELLYHLLDLLEKGVVAKLVYDSYCEGNTITELQRNFRTLLLCLANNGLRLSGVNRTICPSSTVIFGWMWHLPTTQGSPHRIATLASCDRPSTVK